MVNFFIINTIASAEQNSNKIIHTDTDELEKSTLETEPNNSHKINIIKPHNKYGKRKKMQAIDIILETSEEEDETYSSNKHDQNMSNSLGFSHKVKANSNRIESHSPKMSENKSNSPDVSNNNSMSINKSMNENK